MIIIKILILLLIFISTSFVGILISNKYKNRVIELKEVKNALNIFETKIKFTYEPIPEIFREISNNINPNIGYIFSTASSKMEKLSAKDAWEQALDSVDTNLKPEDLKVIKDLGKLLGKTDIQGQISQIELTNTFLDAQIQKAIKECDKNQKLYRTLRNDYRVCNSNFTYINKGGNNGY